MTDDEKAALNRLLGYAKGSSAQSRRVADVLLAWRNAADCAAWRERATREVNRERAFAEHPLPR
ncbi:DUF7673 family protein [Caballeronia zhejiangensis]|uniref:DUF7673 family protein n=1 Tax=Caballeronia zhejiangensis TaxID=871203 RepID=UPI003C7B4B84